MPLVMDYRRKYHYEWTLEENKWNKLHI